MVTVKALISGAAGFIGSHFVDRLLREGYHVTGVDNFITGDSANLAHLQGDPRFIFRELDVCAPTPCPS